MKLFKSCSYYILLTSLLFLAHCSNKKPPAEMTSYKSDEFGFSFSYPIQWKLSFKRNIGLFILGADSGNAPSPQNYYISFEVLTVLDKEAHPRSLDQVSSQAIEQLKKESDFKLNLQENARLHEHEAKHALVEFSRGGQNLKEELLFLKRPEHYLAFYYVAPLDQFEKQRPQFQTLLLSLRFE
jgi:hypothetical protein